MGKQRICSECPKSLADRPAGTKTCSVKCKSRRARRIKADRKRVGQNSVLPPGMKEVSEVVQYKTKDAAHEVLKEELRPLVREQMTDQVLRGIDKLIHLTPTAIELLEQHMQSGDEVVAQRAVTLLLKYTMGHPGVAPAAQTAQPGGMNVVFNLPRPGDATATEPAAQPPSDAAVELRECMECHEHKPLDVFVAGGPKCQECFDGMRDMLQERFGDAYSG